MSKIECTAVNELIDLVQRKPLERESEEDLLFSAPPSARTPRGTQPPPLFGSGPVFPIDAPALPAAPRARQRTLFPVEVSSEPTEMRQTIPHILPLAERLEPHGRSSREDDLDTVYVARQQPIGPLVKKLALPAAAIVAAGIGVGVVIALATRGGSHEHATHVSAPSPFVAPALAAAAPKPTPPKIESLAPPAAAPAPAPAAAKPKLVDIRLESDPPGATATLVDNGATTPLGTTPVDASVDPAKQYDVVFAIEGRTTKVLHVDPAQEQHVAVVFEAPAPAEPVAKAAPPAKDRKHHRHATKQAARVAAAPAPHAAKSAAKADPKDKAPPTGTLAVITTPPCAILIDGQNSGLTSPQKAIALPAGHHSVRLIAAAAHVNKLVAVDVEPRRTTRLVQDFTK